MSSFSDAYEPERTKIATYMLEGGPISGKGERSQGFDSSFGLLRGAFVGGCGFQPNAYSIIDENFLAAKALGRYDQASAKAVETKVEYYLAKAGYRKSSDRREALFGSAISLPLCKTVNQTIEGAPPPSDCSRPSDHWVVTEMYDFSSPIRRTDQAMNTIVPSLLQSLKSGANADAQRQFDTALSWWNGVGFVTQSSEKKEMFHTRDLAYFLFAMRAGRFRADSEKVRQIETRLWSLQLAAFGGGMATTYNLDGSPLKGAGHSSNEINSMSLLCYDPRIEQEWWR